MSHDMHRPPRLAVVVSSDRRRGAEVFGEALAGGLRDRGWDVELFSLTTAGDGPRVQATPLSATRPDELGRLDRAVVTALRRRIGEQAPDLVMANGASTMQYAVAALAFKRARPPLIYVSIGEPMHWIRSPRHRMLRTLILKGVDRVLSVSAVTARQLVDHLGVPAHKVRVAPTGVPARFFEASPRPREGALRVVFVGNLSAEKGPVEAVEVVARAREKADVRLRMLGDGPLRADVERTVAARGLDDTVEVLGSVSDVVPHLEWADVLILTSQTEGLPGVPLEAGAAGVPSVVFAAGGAEETVEDGVTGRVVPVGDVGGAVAALVELAGDAALCRRWGDAARAMVAERFTLDHAVNRYIELLTSELPSTSEVTA
jgi:glycosyltransferase involved in cell wall biosynthesis